MIVPYVFFRSGSDSVSGSVHSASTGFFGFSPGTDGVGRSGSVGVSGVSGISGSVGVSGRVGISGSVGCSGYVGVSGSSGGFLRSVISIFTKFPFSGTVKEMDSASSYPSGADISVRI